MRDERKRCTACGEVKPLDEFYRSRLGLAGRRAECKACSEEQRRLRTGRQPFDRGARPHPSTGQRRCAMCQMIKPLDEFPPPATRTKRGVTYLEWDSRCRECNRARRRAAYRADPEKARQQTRESYRRHQAKRQAEGREQARQWRAENRERHRQQTIEWRRRNPDRQAEQSQIKRARKLGAYVEDVDRLVVLERYDGACGICGGDVDPLRFEMDHIIPLSRGGEHSYANVQPAHPFCNNSKHNNLVEGR